MALNLSRYTRLFVSTVKTGNSSSNTWEVPVLDGYSFSQEANSQTITLNEAGASPVRGQKIFNTALAPADISITTYVRPFYNATHSALEQVLWEALVGPGPVGTYAKRDTNYMEVNFKGSQKHELLKLYFFFQLENTTYRIDEVALNSAEIDFSIDGIAQITWTGQGSGIAEVNTSNWTAGVDYRAAAGVHVGGVDAKFIKNKLSTISLKKATGTTSATVYANYGGLLDLTSIVDFDGTSTYTADITVDGESPAQTISINSSGNYTYDTSIAVNGSTVEQAIKEINYQLNNATVYFDEGDLRITSSTSGSTSTLAVADGVTALFANIDNTNFVELKEGDNTTTYTNTVSGTGTVKEYVVPITGGSITIENNITYLTPEELGALNLPIGSFTGTRAVSGSVTAYLNTGSNKTAGLLTDLASDTTNVVQEFEMVMSMGGPSSPHVDFIMNHAHLVVPSFNVEDVLSTEVKFTALAEEIDTTDELVVRYVAPTT